MKQAGNGRGTGVLALGTALLTLVSVILSLAAAELLAARLVSRPAPRTGGHRYVSSNPANSLGYRDFDYPLEKAAGRFRILVVGDSFTYGAGVHFEETYAKRLEQYLNYYNHSRGGPLFEVLNMGRPRTSTPEQVNVIRKAVETLAPDMIVLGYCLNDAEDWAHPEDLMALRKKHGYEHFTGPAGVAGFLFERSALVRLVVTRVSSALTPGRHQAYYHRLYRDDYAGWQATRAGLADLGSLSRESGVPVVVMIFPLFSFGLEDDYPFKEIHRKLHRALKDASLPVLDLLRFYRGMDPLRLEAVPGKDPHPSALGHQVAAASLWRYLTNRGLLPGPGGLKELPRKARIPYPYAN